MLTEKQAAVHLGEENVNCRKIEFRVEMFTNWPICVSVVGVRQIGKVILAALQGVLIFNIKNKKWNFTYTFKQIIHI